MPRFTRKRGGANNISNLFSNAMRPRETTSANPEFFRAVKESNVGELQRLLQLPGIDLSSDSNDIMNRAVGENANVEIVRLLLADPRFDPAANDQTPIQTACHHGNIEIVQLLLTDPRVDPSIFDQQLLHDAIDADDYEIVRVLLRDSRVDPSVNNQSAIQTACLRDHKEIVEMLLQHPKVDPSINNQELLVEAVENENVEIVKLLLQHPRVDPSVNKQEIFDSVAENENIEIVRLLLQHPRVLNDPEIFEQAESGAYSEEINQLILSAKPATFSNIMWEGFTKGDIEKLDSIFSEDAADYSCCPVCLRYVSRIDGCMYMSHNCLSEPGKSMVDMNWYTMYKNAEGHISWCTICGRICLNHRHYELGALGRKLELVPSGYGGDPFAKNCVSQGGGGLYEKLMRFYGFRQHALLLQEEVGKIREEKAFEELVIAMWTAPVYPAVMRMSEKNLQAKKFAISSNLFPLTKASNNAPNIARNARNAKLLPTLVKGTNAISTVDDGNDVIQFHHRCRNGEINHHKDTKIAPDSFQTFIQSNLNDGKAGPCWLPTCTAFIHPDEIKELVRLGKFPEELYKRYKDAFNRLQRGGGVGILQEAMTAQCVIWNVVTRGKRKFQENTPASGYKFQKTRKNRRTTRK